MQIQSDCDVEKSEFSHGEAFFKAWVMMHFAQLCAQPLELFITGDTVIAHRFAKPGYTSGGDVEATLDQGSFLPLVLVAGLDVDQVAAEFDHGKIVFEELR